MKLPLVDELSNEINRLLIAGSRFAKDDPRLMQLVPKLEALSEKAPIFKRLSTELTALLHATEEAISHKLLALNNLLTAVNLTQLDSADTSIEKQSLTPVLNINDIHTQSTYKQISPLIHVLTNKGTAGRSSAIKEHFVYNQIEECDDWRVNYFMDQALSDKNHDFVKTLDNDILPKVSQTIVPFLYNSFLHQSAGQDLRLKHIFAKSPDLAKPIALEILKTENWGSDYKLKVAAIYILSQDPSQESLILSYLDDKKVEVREAVYEALAQINSASAAQILFSLFDKETKKHPVKLLANALQKMNLEPFEDQTLQLVAKRFETFKTVAFNEAKAHSEAEQEKNAIITNLNLVIPSLFSLPSKRVLAFYDDLFQIVGNPKYNLQIETRWHIEEVELNDIFVHITSFGEDGAKFFESIYTNESISEKFKSFAARSAFPLIHRFRGKETAFNLFSPYYLYFFAIFDKALSLNQQTKTYPSLSFDINHQLTWESESNELFELDSRWFDLCSELFAKTIKKPQITLNYTKELVYPTTGKWQRLNAVLFFKLPLNHPDYIEILCHYFDHYKPLELFDVWETDISKILQIIRLDNTDEKNRLLSSILNHLKKAVGALKITAKTLKEAQSIIQWLNSLVSEIKNSDADIKSLDVPAEMSTFLLSLEPMFTEFFLSLNKFQQK